MTKSKGQIGVKAQNLKRRNSLTFRFDLAFEL